MLDTVVRDLRFRPTEFAWRTPVLTAAAVLSIAVGIAATTSVFSIVDAALFRPPPLRSPGPSGRLLPRHNIPNKP
jgi:hypothetical protein